MEDLAEFVLGEERLQHALKVDVEEALVEDAVLQHVEDADGAATRRFCADEVLELVWKKQRGGKYTVV